MITTNFLGIPVEGDIYSRSIASQRPGEELGPYLFAVLETAGVEAVRWQQYTPYFDDGDVCEFSVGGPSVLLAGAADPDDEEDYDAYDDGFTEVYELNDVTWNPVTKQFEPRNPHPVYEVAKSLEMVLCSGAFDNALLEAFGDHATVTVRKSGITVDRYGHE